METLGQIQDLLERFLFWERLGICQEELESVDADREVWADCHQDKQCSALWDFTSVSDIDKVANVSKQ